MKFQAVKGINIIQKKIFTTDECKKIIDAKTEKVSYYTITSNQKTISEENTKDLEFINSNRSFQRLVKNGFINQVTSEE